MNGIDLNTIFGPAVTPQPAAGASGFGTITSVSPIRLQITGDSTPVASTPTTLVDVNVGDRVRWEITPATRLLIITGVVHDPSLAVPALGNTEDLNDFVWTGKWNQGLNVNTSVARNYPVALAGLLEVTRATANGVMIHQTYTTYTARQKFWRSLYNGTWQAWQEVGILTDWTNLTLQNSWVAYAAGFQTPQFKIQNAQVHVRGLVKLGTTGTIATLPVGARPASTLLFTTSTNPNAYCRIDVQATGAILAQGYNNGWVSLDGIHPFDAEQ